MSGLTGNEAHIMQTRTRKGIRLTDNHDPKRTIARPDSDIARDVARATKTNAQKPDAGIKAIVSDGFVTLEGTAEWDFERRNAESCARNIAGVRGVMNCIRVKAAASAA
jgi:osmotically-inducible protein OsmY